jgi:hypothetical protein
MSEPQNTISYFINHYLPEYQLAQKGLDYRQVPKEQYLQNQFQTTGGFELAFLQDSTLSSEMKDTLLDRLKVENVYSRLYNMSKNNIVAVSECIKGSSEDTSNVVFYNKNIPRNRYINILGCDKDTGIVLDTGFESYPFNDSILNYNDLKISSIHLPGDGPNTLDKIENKPHSIHQFLEKYIPENILSSADVICGDTNITYSKCSISERESIGENISMFFSQKFSSPCLVIMSKIQIAKYRRGFLLTNQQLKKSVFKGYDNAEPDGTIIAIRLHSDITLHDIINTNLSLHFIYHFVDQHNHYTRIDTNISSLSYKIPALQFNTSIEECVDTQNIPIEHVFLDHSVLHISVSSLYKLVKKTESSQLHHNNLVVLNMGSIVNAGHKNWNTEYIIHQERINKSDREIYFYLQQVNSRFGRELPEYDQICGSSILGDAFEQQVQLYKEQPWFEHNLRRQYEKGGIDKMEIYYNQHLLNQITVTMELLLKYMKTGTYGGSAQKKSSAHKKIKKNLKKSRK